MQRMFDLPQAKTTSSKRSVVISPSSSVPEELDLSRTSNRTPSFFVRDTTDTTWCPSLYVTPLLAFSSAHAAYTSCNYWARRSVVEQLKAIGRNKTFGKPYIVGTLANSDLGSNSNSFMLGSMNTRSRIALETYGV